jgi:hypothetical protein
MLGKLFLPVIFVAGFFLYTHQPARTHSASAYVSQACDAASSAGVSATFAWPPPAAGVDQTWVDLGLDANFGLGWYQGHGPLPPSQNTVSISGQTAGLTYFYRVNTLTAGVWKTIARGSLVAGCAPVAVATASVVADATVVVEATALVEAMAVVEATVVADATAVDE